MDTLFAPGADSRRRRLVRVNHPRPPGDPLYVLSARLLVLLGKPPFGAAVGIAVTAGILRGRARAVGRDSADGGLRGVEGSRACRGVGREFRPSRPAILPPDARRGLATEARSSRPA